MALSIVIVVALLRLKLLIGMSFFLLLDRLDKKEQLG